MDLNLEKADCVVFIVCSVACCSFNKPWVVKFFLLSLKLKKEHNRLEFFLRGIYCPSSANFSLLRLFYLWTSIVQCLEIFRLYTLEISIRCTAEVHRQYIGFSYLSSLNISPKHQYILAWLWLLSINSWYTKLGWFISKKLVLSQC